MLILRLFTKGGVAGIKPSSTSYSENFKFGLLKLSQNFPEFISLQASLGWNDIRQEGEKINFNNTWNNEYY